MQFLGLKSFLTVSYFGEKWPKIDENDRKSAKIHENWKKGFLGIRR